MNIYLSIGSNIGNRKKYLNDAYYRISNFGKVKGSHLYRTEPWGNDSLPEFLNACINLDTKLKISELFKGLKKIEEKLGKERKNKLESRKIDIDIILCEDIIFRSYNLEIPHKYFRERKFYLEPLNEIASSIRDPVSGKSVFELLKECKDRKKVWKTGNILQLKE